MAQRGDRPGGERGVSGEKDWAAQTADTVERVVDSIRSKTSVPLTTVARAIVYGLMVAVMGAVVLVLVAVALVRAIDIVTGDEEVWLAHLIVGGIFTLVGMFLLRKARTKAAETR